ncbi:MAG: phospholipase D-like domain-containing protein, partial [Ethanoligenens sp.]
VQKKALNVVKAAGIPIKINSHTGIMHLKVSIIDDSVTTTGSFNYTKSAQSVNDENLVVINNMQISQQYEAQFTRMWSDTTDFQNWN